MKNLVSFFGNLFSTGDIASDLHFKNFSEDHIVRITHYNTTGQYDAMLNTTQLGHTTYYGEITNEDVKRALQESRTRSVDIFIEKFKKKLGFNAEIIEDVYPKTSPEYNEFFPHGLSEYQTANKTTILVLLDRLKIAVTAHSGSFDAAFVTLLSGYPAEFNIARGAQLAVKEDVNAAIITSDQARENLEIIISKNIHTLAIEYILEPEKALAFFNQNLLKPTHRHPQGDDATGQYVLPVPIMIKARADFILKNEPDYYLLISNTGPKTVFGYTAPDINGLPIPPPAMIYKMEPGEAKVFSYADMGGMPYLFFYTDSPDTDGEVTIDQVDSPVV